MAKTGAGLGGLLFLAVLGMCIDGEERPSTDPLYTGAQSFAATTESPPVTVEEFHIHGSLNIRSGPGQEYPVVRTLSRGDRVRLGPKDGSGWAEVYSYGNNREGYTYRASDLVRSYAPRARSVSSSSSHGYSARQSSAESRGYYTGPRGGCYTYSASGRKRYVDRSLCD